MSKRLDQIYGALVAFLVKNEGKVYSIAPLGGSLPVVGFDPRHAVLRFGGESCGRGVRMKRPDRFMLAFTASVGAVIGVAGWLLIQAVG